MQHVALLFRYNTSLWVHSWRECMGYIPRHVITIFIILGAFDILQNNLGKAYRYRIYKYAIMCNCKSRCHSNELNWALFFKSYWYINGTWEYVNIHFFLIGWSGVLCDRELGTEMNRISTVAYLTPFFSKTKQKQANYWKALNLS